MMTDTQREMYSDWRKNVFKQKYVFNEDGAGFKDPKQNVELEAFEAGYQAALAHSQQTDVENKEFYYDEDEHGANTLYDLAQQMVISEYEDGHITTIYHDKRIDSQQMRLTELPSGLWELQAITNRKDE